MKSAHCTSALHGSLPLSTPASGLDSRFCSRGRRCAWLFCMSLRWPAMVWRPVQGFGSNNKDVAGTPD
ncbi:hypothetical protein AMECASPLE_001616 [Ameca splendens]|uniref:Uncharacterized protein n=1 Tax=Ameca splendens TaxID=208324 RepID=A0ABV0XA19_9TELE